MLNTLKMDLYRMWKTKSMYVIWAVMVLALIFSASMSKEEYDDMQVQQQNYEEYRQNDDVNFGMMVSVPTKPGNKVTLFDMVYANVQGKFIALFLVIFAVLFSTADITSGYVKSIAGQVPKRSRLIISKALCLFLYTVISMVIFAVVQLLINGAVFGSWEPGSVKDLLVYLLVSTMLHYGLVMIVSAMSILFHNNVVSMALAVCMCMNVLVIFYGVVDKVIHKTGIKDFSMIKYTVTGKLSMLTMEISTSAAVQSVLVAAVFIIAGTLLGSIVFSKREIH